MPYAGAVPHIEIIQKLEFQELSAEFANLFFRAQKLIQNLIKSQRKHRISLRIREQERKVKISLGDLKAYVKYYFLQDECLTAEVSKATSVEELLVAIQKLCSSSEITLLVKLAETFKIDVLGKWCSEYNIFVKEFCEKKILKQAFAQRLIENRPLGESVRIKFVLQWKEGEKALEDIRKLLRKAFCEANVFINLEVVCIGSVTVICRCPKNLEYFLATIAHHNSQKLIEDGVIYLSVGCCVVIEDFEKVFYMYNYAVIQYMYVQLGFFI